MDDERVRPMDASDRVFWGWRRRERPQPPAHGVGVRWQDRLKRNRDDAC